MLIFILVYKRTNQRTAIIATLPCIYFCHEHQRSGALQEFMSHVTVRDPIANFQFFQFFKNSKCRKFHNHECCSYVLNSSNTRAGRLAHLCYVVCSLGTVAQATYHCHGQQSHHFVLRVIEYPPPHCARCFRKWVLYAHVHARICDNLHISKPIVEH